MCPTNIGQGRAINSCTVSRCACWLALHVTWLTTLLAVVLVTRLAAEERQSRLILGAFLEKPDPVLSLFLP
jgi:hypothetical protein